MSTNILILILVTTLILTQLNCVFLVYRAMIKSKEPKPVESIDTDLLKIMTDETSVEKIDTMVDSFIINAGDMYTLLKLSQNQIHYINEETQKEMNLYIFGTVKKNMTSEVRKIVSLIHVINTEEDLDAYLNLRIKLYLINFISSYNKLQDEAVL